MAPLPPEIIEQISMRLDVRDLIRYRSVSKSWLSLISSPGFIKTHLEHSQIIKKGNRRIVMTSIPNVERSHIFEASGIFFDSRIRHLVGSSNGLVCIFPTPNNFLVINPETREVNKLKNPQPHFLGACMYGFGYDSFKDDYKVVVGFQKDNGLTCFNMLTLKSNTWEVIGDVDYSCISRIGVLYKGALHWVAYHGAPDNKQQVILSFELSENKFKEIPQPDDVRYRHEISNHSKMRLGILHDSLCAFRHEFEDIPLPDDVRYIYETSNHWRMHYRILDYSLFPFCHDMFPCNIWVMNEYGVKQSWERVLSEPMMHTEVVYQLKEYDRYTKYISSRRSLCHNIWLSQGTRYIGTPLYVPSLVSPHVCRKHKRKRQLTRSIKSGKVPNPISCPHTTGSSDAGSLER